MISIFKKYEMMPSYVMEKLQDANVFFSKEYCNYIQNVGGKVWYIINENFILPVCLYEKIRIKYATLPTEMYEYKYSDNNSKQLFLDEVCNVLNKEGVAWILSAASALFELYPSDSLRIPFGSHVIDLSVSEEELWKKIHSKHRNTIRRAEKNNVIIVSGSSELIDDYVKIDQETWARSGRNSYGETFFKNIIEYLGDNAVIYIAYKDNIPQAGACFFVNQKMAYYMFGSSIDNPELGSTNLLHWEVIKEFKTRGIEKYSFVGCRINEDEDSKYHGIQRFKERFGGELVQGYMFKSILKPIKYRLFKVAYFLKNGHELTDAVDQEIHKWKEMN